MSEGFDPIKDSIKIEDYQVIDHTTTSLRLRKRLLGETRVVELPTPVCDSADCVHGAHCRGEQDPRVSTGASDQEEVINWG